MKRDMDLVRAILMQTESAPTSDDMISIEMDGFTSEEIAYHVMLLHQAGLIHALNPSGFGSQSKWMPISLTWQGHEFLAAAKDDTQWNKAKSFLKDRGAPMVFEILKTLLLDYTHQLVFGKPQ